MKLGPLINLLAAACLLPAGSFRLCAARDIPKGESVIVLRAAVPDTEFTVGREETAEMLSRCEDYFSRQFSFCDGSVTFVLGPDVVIPDTFLSNDIASYVIETCRLADKQVDFSGFDNNGDGVVDNVCVIFSGKFTEPQKFSLKESGKSAIFDRKLINEYIAVGEYYEDSPMDYGILCHEYCHVLGLQDFYDTDLQASSGTSEGLWKVLSPMDFSNASVFPDFSAVDYDCLGIPPADTLRRGHYVLPPDKTVGRFFFHQSDVKGEYFLFERRTLSEDSGEHTGLAIYHIDKSLNRSGFSTRYQITLTAAQRWEMNQINCRPDHQCADLVEADQNAEDISAILFPNYGSQTFCSDSEPAFRYWSGNAASIALHGISLDNSGNLSFDVIEPFSAVQAVTYQNEAELSWEIDPLLMSAHGDCTLRLDDSLAYTPALKSDNGMTALLTGLRPGHTYSYVIEFTCEGQLYSTSGKFSTKVIDERNSYPFIYLVGTDRNADGSFKPGTVIPLRIYNAIDVERITWHFNSIGISGSLKILGEGDLRAEITYTDGSTDIITKHISVQ